MSQTQAASASQSQVQAEPGSEYLTFRLGDEEYGLDILKVQEIRGYESATRLAGAPDYIKGVINLRGVIVPIVDMRLKFNLEQAEYGAFTVVIILNLRERIVGMVVDGVSDVIQMARDDIRPAPEFGAVMDTAHIVGLGTVNDRMLIVLDIERLMHEVGADFSVDESADTRH